MKILISGASIAGPALAYWLGRYGHEVTVVELAPALRKGGYAVDFRGGANEVVLEWMGVLDDLRALQTGGSAMRFVAEDDRLLMRLPPEFAGETSKYCVPTCRRCSTTTAGTKRSMCSANRSRRCRSMSAESKSPSRVGRRRPSISCSALTVCTPRYAGWRSGRRRTSSAISATTSRAGICRTTSGSSAMR